MPIRLEECPRQLEGGLPLNPHGGLPQTLLNTSSLRALTVALSEARVRDGTVDCETDREGRETKRETTGDWRTLMLWSLLLISSKSFMLTFSPFLR